MPLVSVSLRRPKTAEFKRQVLNCVHQALVKSGVPQKDVFQRVFEFAEEDFIYDAEFPDVAGARDENFVLVEILWSVGRSVKVKRQVLADICAAYSAAGFDGENLMIVFKETSWENWSFAGGRIMHA